MAGAQFKQKTAYEMRESDWSSDVCSSDLGLGQAVRIGTDLVAALIVGGGIGWVCDTYLFASTPWGMVGGLVLGVVAGIRNAYRSAQRDRKSVV